MSTHGKFINYVVEIHQVGGHKLIGHHAHDARGALWPQPAETHLRAIVRFGRRPHQPSRMGASNSFAMTMSTSPACNKLIACPSSAGSGAGLSATSVPYSCARAATAAFASSSISIWSSTMLPSMPLACARGETRGGGRFDGRWRSGANQTQRRKPNAAAPTKAAAAVAQQQRRNAGMPTNLKIFQLGFHQVMHVSGSEAGVGAFADDVELTLVGGGHDLNREHDAKQLSPHVLAAASACCGVAGLPALRRLSTRPDQTTPPRRRRRFLEALGSTAIIITTTTRVQWSMCAGPCSEARGRGDCPIPEHPALPTRDQRETSTAQTWRSKLSNRHKLSRAAGAQQRGRVAAWARSSVGAQQRGRAAAWACSSRSLEWARAAACLVAKVVLANHSVHGDWHAESRDGNGLVASLATGRDREIARRRMVACWPLAIGFGLRAQLNSTQPTLAAHRAHQTR